MSEPRFPDEPVFVSAELTLRYRYGAGSEAAVRKNPPDRHPQRARSEHPSWEHQADARPRDPGAVLAHVGAGWTDDDRDTR